MVFDRFLRRDKVPQGPISDEDLTRGGDDLGTGVVPNIRRSAVRYVGDERLMEGVYYEVGRRVGHYVLEGATSPLCGELPSVLLYRRLDAWYVTPEADRCLACAPLVGDRGQRRHGWATNPGASDHDIYQRSREEQFRQWDLRRKHHGPHASLPPFDENGSFDDPPFVLIEDPKVNRLRIGEENRVLNDVYARPRNGKKWHRIYFVSAAREEVQPAGRGFAYPCGNGSDEFEAVDEWYYVPGTITVGIPPQDEICKACIRSDAKYGKGKILERTRWDR